MKNKYFTLNEDFEKIIKNTLSDKQVISSNQISTGWTNIVYEVHTNDGDFFFRFPRNDFWTKTIVKDAKFSQFIHNKTDFETVNLKLEYDGERPFSVHKKIEGVPFASKMDSLTPDEIKTVSKEISEFMFQLHNVKFDKNEEWVKLQDFLDELIGTFFTKEDKNFWDYNRFVNEKELCLVHGDLNPSNVLLDENNHVSAIIDFGFAGVGDKYSDIARILSRNAENYKSEIVSMYESFSESELNRNNLNDKINTWKKIDCGYINYMNSIGQGN